MGHVIKMDVVNYEEGHYEHHGELPSSSLDSDDSSSSDTDNPSDSCEKTDDEDLKEDLQKALLDCYKTDPKFQASTIGHVANNEQFQASALCQFMDILNDLDEVLDKSLLACLDDAVKPSGSDDDDVICKTNKDAASHSAHAFGEGNSSINDDMLVAFSSNCRPLRQEINGTDNETERRPPLNLVRSKSLSDISVHELVSLEGAGTPNGSIRGSMRRLDPIVLPAISTEEPLTLPVILFLEHNVNMRPTSAPIQLQVTAANLSGDVTSGHLIVGRRALLMNRALSMPSPGESDVTADWSGRHTARSMTRSNSSSSSEESLNGVLPPLPNLPSATEER